jgi:ABC-type sugar transport system permease subunit
MSFESEMPTTGSPDSPPPGPRAPHLARWLRILAILAVTAIALGLRLRAVDLLPIDYDEDDYLRAGQQYAEAIRAGDWAALTELNYRTEHPPLAKIAYGLALLALPPVDEIPDRPTTAGPASSLPEPHLTVARTVAAVAGTLEVLVLALVSPLAGLFLAVHTFTIKYTSQVMLEALPALTSTVTVVAYARSKRRWNGWLILSAVALGLTAAGKYLYAVVGIAVLIHWLWETWPESRRPAALARWLAPVLLWGLLALAVFVLADPFLWPAPVDRLRESILYHGEYIQSDAVQQANLPLWQPLIWLFQSVPWHPGVFVVAFDALIALLAVLGIGPLWQRNRLYVIWLAVALAFLFAWPTKWPQYILILTAPLALAAATGLQARLWEPFLRWVARVRANGLRWPAARDLVPHVSRRAVLRAALWLLPGAVVLTLITFYPLLYQGGMALTDFNAVSIKDGVNGGIWREVRQGLTGQTEPVEVDIFSFGRSTSKEVRYTGFSPLLQFFTGVGASLLIFEILWTVLSVGLQTALGVGVAWLLHQRGVRFRGWWQTIYILPWAIPEFVGALIWMQIFDPRYGWFFLGTSFPDTPGHPLAQQLSMWQEDPTAALLVLLIAGTWLGFPLIMLAASAGLKMIPHDVYDAAAIDGAGGWQQFRTITWPLLLPLLAPALIIRGIFAFNQFYLFYVLNPPWPLITLASLSFFVFDGAGRYAVSAVINIFTVVLLVLFLLWFNRLSRAGEGVTYA